MIYVKDDDVTYWWWKDGNTGGFVANLGKERKDLATLHRAQCTHLNRWTTQEATYTDPPKACSRDRDEVEQWVRANNFEIEYCKSCKPDQ